MAAFAQEASGAAQARLGRPHLGRIVMGQDQDPLQAAILNSYLQRQMAAQELPQTWANVLGLDALSRLFSQYPLTGDLEVVDQRRLPEEEWDSPWKVTNV